METWLVVLVIVLTLVALGIGIGLLLCALNGAAFLFFLASTQGFVGLAAYVACWVFIFPVMLVICIIVGFILFLHEARG